MFYQNWDAFWIVLLYWSENLIIVFYNVLRMATVKVKHPVEFVHNFLLKGEYKNAKPRDLMGQPYIRIAVLHIAIIAGAFPVMHFGSSAYLLVVLIFIKIVLDIILHNREHKKLQKQQPGSAV